MRVMAALLTLLEVELFVGMLLAAGYDLRTALAAASAAAVLSAEITARLFGNGPDSSAPSQLPGGW
jgi:hypothetical protein